MNKSDATIVLVHGAWADGSSWNKVIRILQDSGWPVIAVQNPLTSIQDDAKSVTQVITDIKGPVILAGHSWGGMALTEAGDHPNVKALVYVSAFSADIGETGSKLISEHPTPPALSTVAADTAGFTYQTEEGMIHNVAPDLDMADAKVFAATQGRLAAKAFDETVTKTAWKTKPTWYVITTQDRVVSVELQRTLATRMKAHTISLDASHMSLVSRAAEVAEFIMEAANTALS